MSIENPINFDKTHIHWPSLRFFKKRFEEKGRRKGFGKEHYLIIVTTARLNGQTIRRKSRN